MKWTIRQIQEQADGMLPLNVQFNLEDSLRSRNAAILAVDPIQLEGYLASMDQDIILHGQIRTHLTMPSTRSLEPVKFALDFPIKERYVYAAAEGNIEDYEETTIVLEQDEIDLEQAVVDSILLNIPSKILNDADKEGNLPSGHDWSVLTEDDYHEQMKQRKSEEGDPRFAALKTLLDKPEDQ